MWCVVKHDKAIDCPTLLYMLSCAALLARLASNVRKGTFKVDV